MTRSILQSLQVGGIIFLLSFFSSLVVWDLILRLLTTVSVPVARDFADRKEPRYAARLFTLARVYTGMKIQRGPRLPARLPPYFLIISNHQSFVDIALLLYAFAGHRLRFVAKESLAHWIPCISPLFRLQRHALVSRSGNLRKTMRELRRLGKIASEGYCPVVFPEGTRSKTGELGHFHLGAVRSILTRHPMPVLCAALDGGYMISSLSHLFVNMRNASYKFAALDLFPPPRSKEEIESVVRKSRMLIEEQLDRWRNTGDRARA